MQTRSQHGSGVARFLFATTLASSTLSASADEAIPGTPIELRLVLVDLTGMAPSLPLGVLDEIQALLKPVGVRVRGEMALPREDKTSGGAYVIFLPFDPSRGRTEPTGGVARAGQESQLTVWAFPPKVAGVVGLDLDRFGRWTNRDRQDFHRALAVVVVHELAHALTGASHRSAGLMSPQLRRAGLLDPSLAVDPDLHAAFRAGAARLSAATQPLAATQSWKR